MDLYNVNSHLFLQKNKLTAKLPITISPRVVRIVNNSGNLIANGERQYLNISFENAYPLVPVKYEIEYRNLTTGTMSNYVVDMGNYKAVVYVWGSNYVLDTNQFEFTVNTKTISSNDKNLSLESSEGFAVDENFTYEVVVDETAALHELGKSEFAVSGKFVSVYEFNLSTDKDITIKFNPNIDDLSKLKVYKLSNDKFTLVSFVELEDGKISVNCNSRDKLYLFRNDVSGDIIASSEQTQMLIIIIIILSSIICLTIFVGIINKYRRTHVKVTKATVVARPTTIAQPAVSQPVQPTNVVNNTPARPPVSMMNTSATSNMSNDELIKKFVIFDIDGRACGLRDGAPESLKRAFSQLNNYRNEK